jgi:hypothetical protein
MADSYLEILQQKVKNPNLSKYFEYMFSSGTPVNAVASQGTLTMDTQPTAGDTMTIGTKVYTFTADGTAAADGEIDVGADLADCKTLVVAAINGTDGINTAHTQVTAAAFVGDDMVITASTKGVAGDLIATTETFTAGTNVFDDVTLGTTTAGVDGTVGTAGQMKYNTSYLYLCGADNAISGANWIRMGASY